MKGRDYPDSQKIAAALKYEAGKRAPVVTAGGTGKTAEKILELAQKHNVTVYSDPELAALLKDIRPKSEIPEELYAAVAEVLAFVYHLESESNKLEEPHEKG